MSFQIIDLFAGAGGLSSGLMDDSDEVVCAVELNADAIESYRAHIVQHQFGEKPEFGRTGRNAGVRITDAYKTTSAWKASEQIAQQVRLGVTTAREILDCVPFDANKMTMLVGGPPCQAYSLAGRVKNKSKDGYLPELDERHFLYKAYLDFILSVNPEVFILENVKGMTSSKIEGRRVFSQILNDLSNPLLATKKTIKKSSQCYKIYSVSNPEIPFVSGMDPDSFSTDHFLLRGEDFGLPQTRHRIFLVGVREDIKFTPAKIDRATHQTSAGSVIKDLPHLRSRFSKDDSFDSWHKYLCNTLQELVLKARALSDAKLLDTLEKTLDQLSVVNEWVDRNELSIANHNCRKHMQTDIARYCLLSASSVGSSAQSKTILNNYGLSPNHKNWNTGYFSDRFKVVRNDAPSGTITSHIAKDGHYFIHPDPVQARSLSVREAARIQTFDDDHIFLGTVTSQYTQVGNAVPPALAKIIKKFVSTGLCP